MGRGELLKKYLAVKAHVECVKPTNARGGEPSASPEAKGVDAGLVKAWADEMRRRLDLEKRRVAEEVRAVG